MKDQILEYLSLGVKPAQVCTIVGCTPAYVSQLLKDEDFVAKLNEAVQNLPEDAGEKRLDAKYESVEHDILGAMQSAIASAELPALSQALKVIGDRQNVRRVQKNPALSQPSTQINVVSLIVPVRQNIPPPVIEMNEKKEVIAVGNVAMAPLSSDGVKALFNKLRGQNEQVRSIPSIADFSNESAKAA